MARHRTVDAPSQEVSIHGEVTHVIEKEGNCSLTFTTEPFYLSIDDHSDLHLGDKVILETSIRIVKVTQDFYTTDSSLNNLCAD